MENNKINPISKVILELGPIIIFFVGYGKIKDQLFTLGGQEYEEFIVATALFVPLLCLPIWYGQSSAVTDAIVKEISEIKK